MASLLLWVGVRKNNGAEFRLILNPTLWTLSIVEITFYSLRTFAQVSRTAHHFIRPSSCSWLDIEVIGREGGLGIFNCWCPLVHTLRCNGDYIIIQVGYTEVYQPGPMWKVILSSRLSITYNPGPNINQKFLTTSL